MKPGDIIASVNGTDVANPGDVKKAIGKAAEKGRKSALFLVKRGDVSTHIAVPILKG
jgi:S1-C subfamily serine protease